MPVGRSAWAIAAGYLGLLSLALFPAPLALFASIIALIDIKRSRAIGQPKDGPSHFWADHGRAWNRIASVAPFLAAGDQGLRIRGFSNVPLGPELAGTASAPIASRGRSGV